MSASCMRPPHLHVSGRSRRSTAQSVSANVQYTTVEGLGTLSKPLSKPWRLDLRPNIGLQSLSQSFASGIQSLSQQLDNLGRQFSGAGLSMVAENDHNRVPRLCLAGRWNKDKSASDMDGYGKALDLMGIHGFKKKTAMVLMDGMEIMQDDTALTAKFVTKVPQWRPTEVYRFKGPSQMSRRDQKQGQQTAVVGTTPDGDLEVKVTWDEPNPGCFREVYRIPEQGVLHIESTTTINGQTASTLQVYRKHGD